MPGFSCHASTASRPRSTDGRFVASVADASLQPRPPITTRLKLRNHRLIRGSPWTGAASQFRGCPQHLGVLYENRARRARYFVLMLEHRLCHAPLGLRSHRPTDATKSEQDERQARALEDRAHAWKAAPK